MRRALLNAVRLPGIRPDTLGGYLSGLGVLCATAPHWPSMRACWRDGVFVLLHEGLTSEDIEKWILGWRPRPYARWWAPHQKVDTKAKTDRNVWRERNAASDERCRLLDAHIVGSGDRNYFNPVFGTGGNIGKRDLASVYSKASELISQADAQGRIGWLRSTLFAQESSPLPELSGAGTWFVYANKTYNSGSRWYREGQISPWSFLLALEGARLLTGGSSRRISAARNYAVFPFVSPSAPSECREDAASERAEFWAPLWGAPATLPAIQSLFGRGQARLGLRAASAPYEFALAACTAGADAGVTAFVRFSLRQTTSRQTYEAVPRERVETRDDRAMEALAKLSTWVGSLPRDGPKDKQFVGIRGPIESALIRLAAKPADAEHWQRVLLLLADSQARIDRNLNLRKTCRTIPLLSPVIFERAWECPPAELQVARAVAAIRRAHGESGSKAPMLVQENIFGVDAGEFPDRRPIRAVWNEVVPLASMAAVIERRLLDCAESEQVPLDSTVFCPVHLVHRFLDCGLDEGQIGIWIRSLSLLDWSAGAAHFDKQEYPASGAGLLYDFFKPFFHPRWVLARPGERRTVGCGVARQLLKLVQQGWWDEAIAVARNRYLAVGIQAVDLPPGLTADCERMAAALLIPVRDAEIRRNFRERWILPEKENR